LSSSTDRELVALAGAGVLLQALVVAVEAAGVIGGLFASGHPVVLPVGSAATTVVHVFSRGVGMAWPLAVRGWLPADMTVPLAFGALVGIVFLSIAIWGLVRLVESSSQRPKAARWAKPRDLAALRVGGPAMGRVILGRLDGALIAAGDRASTLVMGPTQLAGKSSRVVIPALLEWQGPALNTSIKPDVLDATIGVRQRLGEVKVFDPLGRTGLASATWSPVASASDWSSAREVASMLMQVGWEQARLDREPHWRPAAARHLAPLLLAANAGSRTLEDVLRWIDTVEKDEPAELLERSPDPKAERALENLQATWKKDPRYQSSLYATLEEGLDAWQEPSVAAATARSDISASWLLSGPNTLYVVAPDKDQRRLANLFGALLMQVIDEALQLAATRPGRRLSPPLLCALDEVANIAPIPTLGKYASAGVGPGVLLLTVLQDFSQAIEHWGSERAQSILANHTCKLFCSGIGDPATLRYIEGLLGQELVQQISEHRGGGSGARRSTTVQPHLEPLAPPHRVRQADEDTALLVYGRQPPAWIALRPYYKDRALRRLAAIGASAAALVLLVAGCGGGHRASSTASSPTGSLGRPIATAPFAGRSAPGRLSSPPPTRSAAIPERIRLRPPSQSSSTARAVRAVAGRFVAAYLQYQIGRDSPAVISAIRSTCTPQFGRLLLSQPASVPPAQRNNPAFAPAQLVAVSYEGAASFRTGAPIQIVLASYQTTARPPVRGALLVEVVGDHGRWLVSSVRPQ